MLSTVAATKACSRALCSYWAGPTTDRQSLPIANRTALGTREGAAPKLGDRVAGVIEAVVEMLVGAGAAGEAARGGEAEAGTLRGDQSHDAGRGEGSVLVQVERDSFCGGFAAEGTELAKLDLELHE